MKKKIKKKNSDFFSHAKGVMGEKRYNKAVKKGQKSANELRLKMAREMIGLNQTDLKGVSQPEVSKIEARKDIKISTLKKYAKAMGMKVKISFVQEDEDEKQSIVIYG
ncbi:MAG: hypothetical protein DRQ89_11945 [Epsilonproteobacteria bacterium]|nr:MAG: hypothetical protein DRQ89_11945 [Campylobacterota bacterium]